MAKARATKAKAKRAGATAGKIFREVVACLAEATGRPSSYFKTTTRLSAFITSSSQRNAIARQLRAWPALKARIALLTAADLREAETVGDLARLLRPAATKTAGSGPRIPAVAKAGKARAARLPPASRGKKVAKKSLVPSGAGKAKKAAPKKPAARLIAPKRPGKRAIGRDRSATVAPAKPAKKAAIRSRIGRSPATSVPPLSGESSFGFRRFSLRPRTIRTIESLDVPLGAADEGSSGATPSLNSDITEFEATVPAEAPPRARSRYANAALFESAGNRRLDPNASEFGPDQIIRLRLDIGELSADSQVTNPEPVPDRLLPKNIDLDVMVSSTGLGVATDAAALATARPNVAQGRFFLPGDGGAAIAAGGRKYLYFFLKLGRKTNRWQQKSFHARIGYYYRNILVQSQRLTIRPGQRPRFSIETDFTTSADLTGLAELPARPRISIFTNANDDGNHHIVLRHPDQAAPVVTSAAFDLNNANIGATIKELRSKLSLYAPDTRQRSRSLFAQDLAQLAPIGWSLYTQLPGKVPIGFFKDVRADPAGYVMQIARPTTSGFVLPWSYIYEIPLSSDVKPKLCPMVEQWDEAVPLFEGAPRQCPHGPHKRDVLCPFGFWGYRYAIEQLASSDRPATTIIAAPNCEVVIGETQYGVDSESLRAHVGRLSKMLSEMPPAIRLREGKDKSTIETLLGADLPFVYFYCHGERQNVADPNTYLGVGNREKITAGDFIGWTTTWYDSLKKQIWDAVRPLVFVNACHSFAVEPETLVSYLDAFVGRGCASGVIGTEVKVEQKMAMEVAESFVAAWMSGQKTVEEALRDIRITYLKQGNLFGLVYTPYCWSELRIVRQ